MTIAATAAFTATWCFAAMMMWAGVMDLLTMKIRNDLILLILAIYAALAPLVGFGAVEIGTSAAVAFAVLVCMFAFFSMGWIGGGDAKFAAAIALWVGAEHTPTYLLSTAIFGGALTLMLLQFRLMVLPAFCRRVPWIVDLHTPGSGVPYGIAIAAGALFTLPNTLWVTTLS